MSFVELCPDAVSFQLLFSISSDFGGLISLELSFVILCFYFFVKQQVLQGQAFAAH
jgi:hypothetical protein